MLKPPTEYQPPPPPPVIGSALREKALMNLKALVKGNGVRLDKLSVQGATAQILNFQAQGFIRLATHYTTSTVPGKIEKGETIGNHAAFEAAIRNMTIEAQRNPGKRQTIVNTVLERPDKGYAARDQTIKLKTLSRDFVSHEACQACNQTGKSICGTCAGQGVSTCMTCHGRNNILCPACRGNGTVQNKGKAVTCTRCRGRRRVQCPNCQGRGVSRCKTCKGAGANPCAKCKASGFISHLAHVEIIGHLHFDYDRQGLPIELTKLLDAFSARYIEKKDIDLAVLTKPYEESEPAENIPIGYDVRVPYGEIEFLLGSRRIKCTLLGENGELIKGPDFIFELIAKGRDLLAKAASGQGNVGELLRTSARYRILREIIILSAREKQMRQALSKIARKYPIGIGSDQLLQMFMQAGQALQAIAKKPRWLGMAVAGIGFLILAGGYFKLLRPKLAAYYAVIHIDPLLAQTAADILTLLIGTGLIVTGSRLTAARALRHALSGLADSKTMARIMPKTGWTLWAGFALAAFIMAGFYFLA